MSCQHTHIPRAVPDKRHFRRVEVGHYDFTRLADGLRPALVIHNLHNQTVGGNVHSAGRAFMGHESAVTPPVSVAHRTTEGFGDRTSPVLVQVLRGHEDCLDSQLAEVALLAARMLT